jgi:4-amino-4-deoxy-L-arabinose transferase-like glycosyltransferase
VGVVLTLAAILPLTWLALAAGGQEGLGGYVEAVIAIAGDEARASRNQHALYAAQAIGIGFLPWTLLVPGAFVVLLRAWRQAWPLLLLPLLWIGLVLCVFTVLISPRAVHFLPVYPALATLVAWAWSTCSARERRGMSVPLTVVLLAPVVFGFVIAVSPVSFVAHKRVTEIGSSLGLALAGIGLVTALGVLAMARRQWPNHAMLVAGLGALVAVLVLHLGVSTPLVNRAYPTRETAARLAAALPQSAQVAYLDRKFTTGLMFYLPQRPVEIRRVSALRDVAARPGFYALVPGGEMAFIHGGLCVPARVLREASLFDDQYVLVDFEGIPARWCSWPPGS